MTYTPPTGYPVGGSFFVSDAGESQVYVPELALRSDQETDRLFEGGRLYLGKRRCFVLTVYADLVMVINMAVDLLLMAAADRLAGFPVEWMRIVPASVLGGIYSGLCLIRELRFLGSVFWRLVFLVLICVVAFGWNRSTWKRCAVFVLLTMTLGGVALTMGKTDILSLIISCCGLWVLCILSLGDGVGKRRYVPVTVVYNSRKRSVIALRDSGNTLCDPVSGEQVLVVSPDIAEALIGLSRNQLANPIETLSQNPGLGLRLIPYHAVGNGNGMLLGMRFSEVWIGNIKKSAVIAFAPEGIGEGEMHQALVATG